MKKILSLVVLSLVLFGCATSNSGGTVSTNSSNRNVSESGAVQYVPNPNDFDPEFVNSIRSDFLSSIPTHIVKQNVTLDDFQGTWVSSYDTDYIFTGNRFVYYQRGDFYWMGVKEIKFSGTFTFDNENITLHLISEERDGIRNYAWIQAFGDTFTLKYEISDNGLSIKPDERDQFYGDFFREGYSKEEYSEIYINERVNKRVAEYLNQDWLPTMFEGTWTSQGYTYTFNGVKYEFSRPDGERSNGYFIFDEETITFLRYNERGVAFQQTLKYVLTDDYLSFDNAGRYMKQ